MRVPFIAALLAWSLVSAQKVAIPGSSISRGVNEGARPLVTSFVYRVIRDFKSSFVSDLEAVVLQLTRPVDRAIPSKVLTELMNVLSTEYVYPEYLVTLLAKLSRKMNEKDRFTQLKAVFTLHYLMNVPINQARKAIKICVEVLRGVHDERVNDLFFSSKSFDGVSDTPSLSSEMAKLTSDYLSFVLDLIDLKGDESDMHLSAIERAERLRNLLHSGVNIEEKYRHLGFKKIVRQCVDGLQIERKWILRHLVTLYEVYHILMKVHSLSSCVGGDS